MSKLSQIFRNYENNIEFSRKRYLEQRRKYRKSIKEYLEIFRKFGVNYSILFNNESYVYNIMHIIKNFFGENLKELNFIAIDGTTDKKAFEEYVVFYSLSCPIKGKILFQENPPKIRYIEPKLDEDASVVSFVPINYIEMGIDYENLSEFENKGLFMLTSDDEKVNLNNLNVELMKLSEVFLAYKLVKNSDVNLILLDHSISSLFVHSEIDWKKIGILNGDFSHITGVNITPSHAAIILSHPIWPENDFKNTRKFPTLQKFRIIGRLVADLIYFFNGTEKEVPWQELLEKDPELDKDLLLKQLERQSRLVSNIFSWDGEKIKIGYTNNNGKFVSMDINWLKRLWKETERFFEELCTAIFEENNPEALIYKIQNGIEVWISQNDVIYLLNIGIRLLIEKAWQKKVLLVGIAKDSSSRYLTKNLFQVFIHKKLDKNLVNLNQTNPDAFILPPTDRIFFELLCELCEDFEAPCSSIEFDAAFNTLRVKKEENGNFCLTGVRGDILFYNLLFGKSLLILFTDKKLHNPLIGHALFMDRLLFPKDFQNRLNILNILDKNNSKECLKSNEYSNLGKIELYYSFDNALHGFIVFLLSILTRDIYPEAIGYPDPLHRADIEVKAYAKNLLRKLIESATILENMNPLNKSFRTIRESGGRTK